MTQSNKRTPDPALASPVQPNQNPTNTPASVEEVLDAISKGDNPKALKPLLDQIYANKLLEIIGEDEKWNVSKPDYGFRDQGKNELRAELRQAIKKELLNE